MTESKRQDRLTRILEAALELPPAERDAFVAKACGDDHELQAEITDLLSREGEVSEFLGAAREAIAAGGASDPFSADSVDPDSETLPRGHPDLAPDESGTLPERPPGTRIRYFGDYELLEEIARGGMGVVYKARQTSLDRIVAIKMIRSGEFASDEEVQRFRSEAEAAANLQHPNIVAIYEMGEHDGQYYFSMDYVDGKNLEQLIKEGSLHMTELIEILKKVADAVHWAHQRGTLHRDLKPANIVIDKAGEPYITDFGLAKRTEKKSGLTQTGAAMGTPAYMPPEQALGRWDTFGPASEVYSLGAILYEMLTERPPFVGDNALETLWQVQKEQPVSPSSRAPRVPAELDTICLKCLEKQPHKRYPTAHALAEELRRFLSQEPIEARPPSFARKARIWSQQHPSVITSVLATVLLGMFWLAYGLWFENSLFVLEKSDPDRVREIGSSVRRGYWMNRLLALHRRSFGEQGGLVAQLSVFVPYIVSAIAVGLFYWKKRQRILFGRRLRPSVLLAFGVLGLLLVLWEIYLGTVIVEWHIEQRWAYAAELAAEREADAAGLEAYYDVDGVIVIEERGEDRARLEAYFAKSEDSSTLMDFYRLYACLSGSPKVPSFVERWLRMGSKTILTSRRPFNDRLETLPLNAPDPSGDLHVFLVIGSAMIFGVYLIVNALREHNFVMFTSTETEHAALKKEREFFRRARHLADRVRIKLGG